MSRPPLDIPDAVRSALALARVCRIGVMDETGVPLMAPYSFFLEGQSLFLMPDDFPLNIYLLRETQMDSLNANPNMAVLIDHWEENLNKTGVVLLRGVGEVLPAPGLEQRRVLGLIRDKYAQYRGVNLKDQPIIKMDVLSIRHWGEMSNVGTPLNPP